MRQTCTQQPQIALPAYGAIHSAINSPAPMPPREASFCEPMAPISPSSRKTEEASIDFSFLSKYSIALKIDRGDVFIREDAPAKHFYLIGKGAAMSFKTLPGGRRQVTHFTGGGDLVGLSNLDTFGYTAKSLSDVWLYRFPRSILSSFCSKLPGFTNLLFRNARY